MCEKCANDSLSTEGSFLPCSASENPNLLWEMSGPERALLLKSAATNTQDIDNNIHLEFHELENILLNANGVAGDGTWKTWVKSILVNMS